MGGAEMTMYGWFPRGAFGMHYRKGYREANYYMHRI